MTVTAKKSAPRRTCVGCRKVATSEALVRLTLHDGAWLCPQPDCLQQATRRRALDRALRVRAPIDDDLRSRFTSVCEQRKAVM